MKPWTLALLLCLAISARAERFEAKEFQLSLEAPEGWRHEPADVFGYVIVDPKSRARSNKIRIHAVLPPAATPKEQAGFSLEGVNKTRGYKKWKPIEFIRYEKPVKTKSGVEGYMAAHGLKGAEDQPYINHYYFKLPSRGMICVCAYLSGLDRTAESSIEKIILDSLQFQPASGK